MEGKQKTAYEGIMDIATKILDGFYGTHDDFDVEPLEDDFDCLRDDIT